MDLPTNDVTILRELAKRKAEIAADPINLERKQAWYNLDSGEGDRPMILAEKGGVSDERKAITRADMTCESQAGRRLERRFRSEFYEFVRAYVAGLSDEQIADELSDYLPPGEISGLALLFRVTLAKLV